jgi:hypothetical protein
MRGHPYLRTVRSLHCATDAAAAIFYWGNVHMRSSRGRLSGFSVFLSGAFVAVWAAGALAQLPFEGGTWSFRWVIHSKSCGTSISYSEGRRTVASGCFPDMTPIREKRTINIHAGDLPTVGPLWPCTLAREQREQLVRYVASRTHPRRFVLHVNDRAALIPLFASCSIPPEDPPLSRYRLNRWSSVVTVSADGKHVRQREILWDSFDGNHGRDRYRTTASVRGKRTGNVATASEVGQDTSDTAH